MPEGQVLEFSRLTKQFGAVHAVSDLTARVQPGAVTGFLGPNGAGKTTTLRMLLGLVRATSGTATIGGVPYAKLNRPLQTVGAVLEASSFHPGRTGANHLKVYAQAAGIAASRIDETLGLVGLADAAGRKVGGYSLGMRQRLGLAYALLGDPGVLVLDEPANGLDPEGIKWLRGFLQQLAREGRTVLVSSHLLTEIQQTADAVLILANGRRVFSGAISDLVDPSEQVTIVDSADRAALVGALRAAGIESEVLRSGVNVRGAEPADVGKAAAAAGVALTALQRRGPALEEVFLELVSGVRVHPSANPDFDGRMDAAATLAPVVAGVATVAPAAAAPAGAEQESGPVAAASLTEANADGATLAAAGAVAGGALIAGVGAQTEDAEHREDAGPSGDAAGGDEAGEDAVAVESEAADADRAAGDEAEPGVGRPVQSDDGVTEEDDGVTEEEDSEGSDSAAGEEGAEGDDSPTDGGTDAGDESATDPAAGDASPSDDLAAGADARAAGAVAATGTAAGIADDSDSSSSSEDAADDADADDVAAESVAQSEAAVADTIGEPPTVTGVTALAALGLHNGDASDDARDSLAPGADSSEGERSDDPLSWIAAAENDAAARRAAAIANAAKKPEGSEDPRPAYSVASTGIIDVVPLAATASADETDGATDSDVDDDGTDIDDDEEDAYEDDIDSMYVTNSAHAGWDEKTDADVAADEFFRAFDASADGRAASAADPDGPATTSDGDGSGSADAVDDPEDSPGSGEASGSASAESGESDESDESLTADETDETDETDESVASDETSTRDESGDSPTTDDSDDPRESDHAEDRARQHDESSRDEEDEPSSHHEEGDER